MSIAIVIDDWKLPIFDRHLAKAGYRFTISPGLSVNTLALSVASDDAKALEPVVRAASAEAARSPRGPNG